MITEETYRVTFTNTFADRCEICGEDATATYRLDGDANAADACYGCAADYALRAHYSEFYADPSEAWTEDADHLRELAEAEYPGGYAGLIRGAFAQRISASALAEASAIVAAAALRRAARFDAMAEASDTTGRGADALRYWTLADDARRTADRVKGSSK